MGSAPQNATSHDDRSSDATSSGVARRAHNSNAKLGPPLMVPRKRLTAWSHRSGFCRNAMGDISATGKPAYSGWRMPPMRPMSWYGGSQMTPTLSRRTWNAPEMSPRLCSRFACVSITPLGVPVLPDVYWRNASDSAPTSCGVRQSRSPPSASASVAIQCSARKSGACSKTKSDSSRMPDVVRTTDACASWMMARSRGRVRSSRIGSGGYAGTATAPAYRHPKKPAT
ncbi:hypothetical protein COSO111634_27180 [Corallococcus soli]